MIGHLQFATTFVKVGKAFLRHLYDLTIGVSKLYHKIRLNSSAKEDLKMWVTFLREFNGKSIIYEPSRIKFHQHVYRCIVCWIWGDLWVLLDTRCLARVMEGIEHSSFGIISHTLDVAVFGHKLGNSRILFHCDNITIVQIINKQSSKDNRIMSLLRPLGLALLKYNISFHCEHFSSEDNDLADVISRFQETDQLLHATGLCLTKTHIPS